MYKENHIFKAALNFHSAQLHGISVALESGSLLIVAMKLKGSFTIHVKKTMHKMPMDTDSYECLRGQLFAHVKAYPTHPHP